MKLNKRGKRVRAVLILVGVVFIVWASGHIWYTVEGGYCFGSATACVGL